MATFTDYKFRYVKREASGNIIEVAVRFYEGNKVLVEGLSKYRRSNKITEKTFTTSDFGTITTDNQLRAFLNFELSKDNSRTAIEEQAI